MNFVDEEMKKFLMSAGIKFIIACSVMSFVGVPVIVTLLTISWPYSGLITCFWFIACLITAMWIFMENIG